MSKTGVRKTNVARRTHATSHGTRDYPRRIHEGVRLDPLDRWIELVDGVRLHVSLWLPDVVEPVPCLLEALPYRKDDVTASYAATYERLAGEGFAVCRVDLRGTGSSSGIARDEYPEEEIGDLRTVIDWLAKQPWCSGAVGAFGTSYSGFNSLHLAAAGIPHLGAVCAFYSSDDRFTDDVHYTGGALRALDIVDYVTYMVAMNALPPVPAIWGPGWENEWRHRIGHTPPWVLDWLDQPSDGPFWRRGSIRHGPAGAGYDRIACPTMLVGGWADGYRNNTFRTIEHLDVPYRLLVGPWGHEDPARARPGPNIDAVAEMIAWFDHHLRSGPAEWEPIQVFVRTHTQPSADGEVVNGSWRQDRGWPLPGAAMKPLDLGPGVRPVPDDPDIGATAWISCAGALPWGQPLDQTPDEVRSLTWAWTFDEPVEVVGNPSVRLRLRSRRADPTVSVKLSDVAPDGRSMLITRGYLDIGFRDTWPVAPSARTNRPAPFPVGSWHDIDVELEATAHRLEPGHTLRIAVAAADWPNIWPPSGPAGLELDCDASRLELPVVGPSDHAAPIFAPGPGPEPVENDVEWAFHHDVLGRTKSVTTRYGGTYQGRCGSVITDEYRGEVAVSLRTPGVASARGNASFAICWPETKVATIATVTVESDEDEFRLNIDLSAAQDDEDLAARSFRATFQRRPW